MYPQTLATLASQLLAGGLRGRLLEVPLQLEVPLKWEEPLELEEPLQLEEPLRLAHPDASLQEQSDIGSCIQGKEESADFVSV